MILTAVITKRCAEALFLGVIVAAVIYAQGDWWSTFFSFTLAEIGDSAWCIIMFGMFGALIRIMEDTGAAVGFADLGAKFANSRKKTMIATWILGMLIFIEDYLNSLGVGVAMRNLTDKWKISREYLAFIVNSTGASVCILVPISSWAVVYSANIEQVSGQIDALSGMSGFEAYVSGIPFMLYAFIAILCVPLFALGIIPLFGPMKKVEERAIETGKTFPEWYYEEGHEEKASEDQPTAPWWNFVVPILAMVVAALLSDLDITFAIIVAVGVAGIMLMLQRKLKLGQFFDCIFAGFREMQYVTILVIAAFILQDFNDALGLTPFVIESVEPILSHSLFPVVVFFVIALIAFATGSFWGVAAISFPIILPLAAAMDVNISLAIGTVTAATAFGSHACFYSDAVTVTAAATGIRNIDYARTALPLIAVPFSLAIIAYLILGFVMA